MAYLTLPYLRERCDKFQDGNVSPHPSWVSKFNLDKREKVSNAAELALNTYNQKEQKNFDLEKVCKLNHIGPYFCMTFRAKNAETSECHLFRGVVQYLTRAVFLCEIKEPDDIAILSDCAENYVEVLSESKDDHSPCTRKRARFEKDLGDDSTVAFVDVNYGSFDVSGGVNVGLVDGSDVGDLEKNYSSM